MSGGVSLGQYSPRLAAEADLWQEFRFTKLKMYYLPFETPGNRNQCSIVGYSNVALNAGVASAADIVSLPSSHVFVLGGAGTAYPTTAIGTRQAWSIPHHALRPAFVPWLKCSNSASDFTGQGDIWGYFNYTASTGPNVWMYVEWECQFRNPVPAGVTLVLNKESPTYRDALLSELAKHPAEPEEDEQESKCSEVVVPAQRVAGRPALVFAHLAKK